MFNIFPDPLDYLDSLPWYHQIWGYPAFWLNVIAVYLIGLIIILPLSVMGNCLKLRFIQDLCEKLMFGLIFITFGLLENILQKLK